MRTEDAGRIVGGASAVGVVACGVVALVWVGSVVLGALGTGWTPEEYAQHVTATVTAPPSNPRGSRYMLNIPVTIRNGHPSKTAPAPEVYCTVASAGQQRSERVQPLNGHRFPRLRPGEEVRVWAQFSSSLQVGDSEGVYHFIRVTRCTALLNDLFQRDPRL